MIKFAALNEQDSSSSTQQSTPQAKRSRPTKEAQVCKPQYVVSAPESGGVEPGAQDNVVM